MKCSRAAEFLSDDGLRPSYFIQLHIDGTQDLNISEAYSECCTLHRSRALTTFWFIDSPPRMSSLTRLLIRRSVLRRKSAEVTT